MTVPVLRVTVDGDNNKVYHAGEKVTGQIWLVVEDQAQIESLKLVFAGSCITKTTRTRPLSVYSTTDEDPSRQPYEEKIRLFNREKSILTRCQLAPKKYSWAFEFVFPESTEPQYKRAVHGPDYMREPHPLPPSLRLKTDIPGGWAQISYFVQARMTLAGSTETKRCKHTLRYQPKPPAGAPTRARSTSTVLYGQTWKPCREKDESRVKKVFSGVSMNSTPRIVPTFYHPTAIAPGQHIPLSLNRINSRDPCNHAERQCTIDSLSVTISTYSTTICGNSATHPEDSVSKHVNCIARTNMQPPIPFNKTVALTSSTFRLIDDAECIPTFKTYTITRRYALDVSIGIKYNDQHFIIRSTTSLHILPRIPRSPSLEDEDAQDMEPLPRYSPREPSGEFAPDYEEVISNALERSSSSEQSLMQLSRVGSHSSSLFSEGSAASTGASTPADEIEGLDYQRVGG